MHGGGWALGPSDECSAEQMQIYRHCLQVNADIQGWEQVGATSRRDRSQNRGVMPLLLGKLADVAVATSDPSARRRGHVALRVPVPYFTDLSAGMPSC